MNRRAEPVLVAVALLAAMSLAALLTDHAILFTRPLWLDEYHTVLVASRDTPVDVVRDLWRGADLAPPLLHLAAWCALRVFGAPTPPLLHALSFAAVWTGLIFVYLTLRRRCALLPAVAGVLAVGSHPLVVSHTFEARYYGPWLLFCAFFCWSVGLDAAAPRSQRRDVLIAVAAVLVCTIHWFGALTLVLMCLGALLCHPERACHPERSEGSALPRHPERACHPERSEGSALTRRHAVRRVAPALAGGAALLLCLPLLFAQRSRFSTPIWVPDLDAAQVLEMSRAFFLAVVPIAATLILLASTLAESPWRGTLRRAAGDPGVAALTALALMPVAVLLVSLLVQPTMLPRYAIATALAWAPLAAAAAALLPVMPRAVWCALLAAVWWVNLRGEAADKRDFATDVQADVRAFDAARAMSASTGMPIVFQARHVLYPVAAQRPHQRASMALLVASDSLLAAMFPHGTPVGDMARFFRFEHDAVRLHAKIYGFPRLVDAAGLAGTPRFLLVGRDLSLPRGYKDVERFGRAVAPGFRVTRLRDNLALFER